MEYTTTLLFQESNRHIIYLDTIKSQKLYKKAPHQLLVTSQKVPLILVSLISIF